MEVKNKDSSRDSDRKEEEGIGIECGLEEKGENRLQRQRVRGREREKEREREREREIYKDGQGEIACVVCNEPS